MCGINGFFSSKYDGLEIIQKTNLSLKHRGPDSEGIYNANNGLYLGHRRLSIIDVKDRSNQPFVSDCGNYILIFNGEIYNFLNLKLKLQNINVKFKTQSDTEVLLQSYIKLGLVETLNNIRGMFSFCIYDKIKEKLFLVRDHVGEKPLYYYKDSNFFYFSSEVKTFANLKSLGFEKKFNFNLINEYFRSASILDNSNTYFNNISKLEPAHYIEFDIKKNFLSKKKYWQLSQHVSNISNNLNEISFEQLLTKSIKERLISDVPLGVMLSGGLDSSVIASIAQKLSSKKINTFSLSFGDGLNENYYANLAAKTIGTNHYEIKVDEKKIFPYLYDNIEVFDDLGSTDPGILSLAFSTKFIRDHGIKTLLFGEGADEILAGYKRFALGTLPFSILPNKINLMLYYYFFSRDNFKSLKKFYKNFIPIENKINNKNGSYLHKFLKFEIEDHLPNNYLMKIDKSTMYNSIEARVPYLDIDLISFLLNIDQKKLVSTNWFFKFEGNEKKILRNLAKKYLPQDIHTRRKFGSMLNTKFFILSNLDKIYDLLSGNNNTNFFEYFSKKEIYNELDFIKKKKIINNNNESFFWRLLILLIYLKKNEN